MGIYRRDPSSTEVVLHPLLKKLEVNSQNISLLQSNIQSLVNIRGLDVSSDVKMNWQVLNLNMLLLLMIMMIMMMMLTMTMMSGDEPAGPAVQPDPPDTAHQMSRRPP